MVQDTQLIMGMPVCVAIHDAAATRQDMEAIFRIFTDVDDRFSPFRLHSELSRLNRHEIALEDCSTPMREIVALAETTKLQSDGYFDICRPDGTLDPCGIVKGWAINEAAQELARRGLNDFYIDAGGDIQTCGKNGMGSDWTIGIRNPFRAGEIVKVLCPRGAGVATSGSYLRGSHIYNPHAPATPLDDIISLTVIGPDILDADRFATAAFAMGRDGIIFIERLAGFEAYEISACGIARMTSGLERYLS